MAVPFGFSVGDFLAAIELTIRIGKALKENGGATEEFRQLQQDLVLLRQVLEILQDLQPAGSSPSRINAIKGMALTCLTPLRDFANKLDKSYASSLGTGSSTQLFRRGSKKIQWALFSADEVSKFRATISAKVVSTTLLLGVCNSEVLSTVHETTRITQDFLRDQAIKDDQNLDHKFSDLSVNLTQNHDDFLARVVQLREGLNNDVSSVKDMQIDQHQHLVRKLDKQQEATQILTAHLTKAFREADSHYTRLVGVCSGIRSTNRRVLGFARRESLQIRREIRQVAAKQHEAEFQLPSAYQFLLNRVKMLQTVGESILSLLIPFSQKVLDYLQQNMAKNLEIFTILLRLEASLPKAINHVGADTIIFEDVLGRTKQLPYAYFRHWEVFESMLRCEFRGLPGERKVLDGQYFIINNRLDGLRIDKNSWEQRIFPETRIRMSVEIARWGASGKTLYCPRCRHLFKRHHPMETTLYKCTACELAFFAQAIPKQRRFIGLLGKENDDTIGVARINSAALRSYVTAGPKPLPHMTLDSVPKTKPDNLAFTMSSLEARDISVFRLIHLKDASITSRELPGGFHAPKLLNPVYAATTEAEDAHLESYLRAVLVDDSFVVKSPTAYLAAHATLFQKMRGLLITIDEEVHFLDALHDAICAVISDHVYDLSADIQRQLRSSNRCTISDRSHHTIHAVWPEFKRRVGIIAHLSKDIEVFRKGTFDLDHSKGPKKVFVLQHAYLEMLSLADGFNNESLRRLIVESVTALDPEREPDLMQLYRTTYKPKYQEMVK